MASDLIHSIREYTYVVYQHKAAKDFSLKVFRKAVKHVPAINENIIALWLRKV